MLGNWERVFKFAAKCSEEVEEREDNVDDAIVVLKTHHPKCVLFSSLISYVLLQANIIKNIINKCKENKDFTQTSKENPTFFKLFLKCYPSGVF